MRKHKTVASTNGHSVITQDDPILKRFNQVERLLHQLIQRGPTEHQLRDLCQRQWDTMMKLEFSELSDLRDECVRLLKILREKAATSSAISQEELNG